METTQQIQEPIPLIYNGKEYKLKPYSIEMGMAYDLYIEPNRVFYSQNFADTIDTEYLAKYDDRIAELNDTIASYEAELTDEQQAAKNKFIAELELVKADKLADDKAQMIERQINDVYTKAFTHAFNQKNMAFMFLNAVIEGGVKDIVFGTEEYYLFAMQALTNFFLLKTAMLKSVKSTPINTQ